MYINGRYIVDKWYLTRKLEDKGSNLEIKVQDSPDRRGFMPNELFPERWGEVKINRISFPIPYAWFETGTTPVPEQSPMLFIRFAAQYLDRKAGEILAQSDKYNSWIHLLKEKMQQLRVDGNIDVKYEGL